MSDEESDPFVKDLMPGYLARRREELLKLEQAVADRDYQTLRLVGHNLHGSGGAYGLPRISELGRELEQAARAQDETAAGAVIDALRVFVETL